MNSKPENLDFESISMLMPKAKTGDDLAQNEICRQVRNYLLMMAERELDPAIRRKVNPSDVVQMTMTRMIGGIDDFRGKSSREFYGWLNQILRNEIRATRRNLQRDKRDIRRENEMLDRSGIRKPEKPDPLLTPSSEAIRKETIEKFERILTLLPDDYATVIRLRSLDELPFKDVAEKMERTTASVTNLWYRAIVKFQEEFSKLEDGNSS